MSWLTSYIDAAALTDNFQGRDDHLLLLAAGLLGEAGSIVAEIKKMNREAGAYPGYRQRLTEELGDFLWYYVRLAVLADADFVERLETNEYTGPTRPTEIGPSLDLGSAVGRVLSLVQGGPSPELKAALNLIWSNLAVFARCAGVSLEEAANANLAKIRSRWPTERIFHELFDEGYPVHEQIPRKLTIDFLESDRGRRLQVLLRYNGIGIGSRLTDNITDPDGYRYHDVFHIAHAVFLGWSPVVRALLRCKRKSDPGVDENQDGARAVILEEAVSFIVFSRAKQMKFFEGATQIDYDLLKCIQEFTRGYEVDRIPLWQWEASILEGYRVFRLLRSVRGGRVTWDIASRTLAWAPLKDPQGS